jgi:uncharacterized protein YkwD
MGIVRTALRGRVAVLALLLAIPLTLGFAPSRLAAEASELPVETVPLRERPDLVGKVLRLTNADRAAAGLDPVQLDERRSRFAVRHSGRMAEYGYLFHSPEPQLRRALDAAAWSVGGENVGVGRSVRTVQDAFMRSPSHRSNVLGAEYDRVAIGVVEADGVTWITVVFSGE